MNAMRCRYSPRVHGEQSSRRPLWRAVWLSEAFRLAALDSTSKLCCAEKIKQTSNYHVLFALHSLGHTVTLARQKRVCKRARQWSGARGVSVSRPQPRSFAGEWRRAWIWRSLSCARTVARSYRTISPRAGRSAMVGLAMWPFSSEYSFLARGVVLSAQELEVVRRPSSVIPVKGLVVCSKHRPDGTTSRRACDSLQPATPRGRTGPIESHPERRERRSHGPSI